MSEQVVMALPGGCGHEQGSTQMINQTRELRMTLIALLVRRARILCGGLLLMLLSTTAFGSVTMLGSRIIYSAGASSVDVQLRNNDDIPYVIQTWFDNGNVDATPAEGKNIPFVATPPVFRIQPKAGQVLRVMYTGATQLPQDRESVFWFNALQVPPSNLDSEKGQNKMLVMLRTRVKLFYRPASLGAPVNQLKGLKVTAVWDAKKGYGINVENPQPWYASLTHIDTQVRGQKHQQDADMVAPFGNRTFWFSGWKNKTPGDGTVSVRLVNDQGARVSEQYHVTFP